MPNVRRHPRPDPKRENPISLRRVLGAGEDPFAWSFPVFRMRRIQVRLHLIVPLWIGAELLFSLAQGRLGPLQVSMAIGSLLLIASLREWMRAHAARVLGADKDTAIAWPLGGLTPVSRPGLPHPIAAELGGLVFGVAVMPFLVTLFWMTGADLSALLFNPLLPGETVGSLVTPAQQIAWWLIYANGVILALNLLLPMYPYDAAGILYASLRQRLGSARANDVVLRCGLFSAISLLVCAATAGETRLIAVAIFAAAATLHQFRKNEFLYALSRPMPDRAAQCPDESPEPEPEPAYSEQSLDEVLAKITRQGIHSLTPRERSLLEEATRIRRGS